MKKAASPAGPISVSITVDAQKTADEFVPIWRFFGADEPNYAYMKDGRKLLAELGRLSPRQVYFRCHHLLTSGDGSHALKWGSTSAYKEDADGNPVYDWTINDRIFDSYLEHSVKPFVQIGFMPEALSVHPQDYPHDPPLNEMAEVEAGQAHPPKDYVKWGNLVFEWAKHCVERYGKAEVETWYWEVWNEPDRGYWQASAAEYFKLYDYAVDGVRRASANARVGGPHTAGGTGGEFLGLFLTHCAHGANHVTGAIGSPLDFIAFHAKGSPVFTDGHVRMGMSSQFKNIDDACAVIASFPEYRQTPVIIGECDPEGLAARRTPADAYRNGTMYSSYTAASFARLPEIAQKHGVNLQGALTWAFEFEDQPPFAGFRQLASCGIALPVLNVFRMFARMSGEKLRVASSAGLDADTILTRDVRSNPDISALATLNQDRLAILLWHYHDDDVPGPDASIELLVNGLVPSHRNAMLTQYCVDAAHSNAYEVWRGMGSPSQLTRDQQSQLEKAGDLAVIETPREIQFQNGKASFNIDLKRQGVALLLMEFSLRYE